MSIGQLTAMDQSQFWNLLAKKIAGEASPEDLEELDRLLKCNPDWAYQAEHIHQFWQLQKNNSDKDSEKAFLQHVNKMKEAGIDFPSNEEMMPEPVPSSGRRRKVFAFSIALTLVILIAGLLWFNNTVKTNQTDEKNYSEVSSPVRSRTKLVLPDSTVVWLNAGSKLTYNEHFGTTNRNTNLVGEAYFDVKKGPIPFIIHAKNVHIRVLGTAFNVKAYPGEKTTETSLLRGRVEITLDERPGEPFILKPDEKLIVASEQKEKDTKAFKPEPIVAIKNLTHVDDSTIVETSWVNNKFIFQDESFFELSAKMQRWYGVTIEFIDEEVANERLSGTFTTETIKEALDELQMTTRFHYLMKGNSIVITR